MARDKPEFLNLLCIGNPVVELHADVPVNVLEKYGLSQNAAVQVEERHRPLCRDLLNGSRDGTLKVEFVPGGGAPVAALVAALLSRNPDGREGRAESHGRSERPHVVLIGGVGRDELAHKLRELCRNDNIQALLSETDVEMTGWRAVLRTRQEERSADSMSGLGPPPGDDAEQVRLSSVSVATFTGAGHEYKADHLRFKVWESVEAAVIVYVESIFLTVSPDSARLVAEHCAKVGKTFALNLSARYLCKFFREKVLTLLPYIDYIIGNESEYFELAEGQKDEMGRTIDDIVSWFAKHPRADGDPRRKRYVIATCGNRPTIVASTWRGYGVKVQRFPVPPVKSWRFVSKDGAGDAFAGGFLYGLMRSADLDSCVQMALYAAQVAVQRTKPAFTFKDRPQIERQADQNWTA